jgi:rhodanese-related sulfurtransferase
MKKQLTFLFFAIQLLLVAQSKEFVCLPCGSSCDSQVFAEGGACPHCSMALVEKSSVHFTNLSLEEVCKRLAANPKVVLLDVRSPGEFNGTNPDTQTFGHFKNALNINVTELESRLPELEKYKNSEIVVYCSHSHRSPRASYLLGSKGFKNVKNMAGGVSTIASSTAPECLKSFYEKHAH